MTPEQLQAIKDRWAKAIPGPWHYDGMHNEITTDIKGEYWLLVSELREHPGEVINDKFGHSYNANFKAIASAPSDIADLLAFINQQAEQIERMREQLNGEHCAFLQAKAFAEELAESARGVNRTIEKMRCCGNCNFNQRECDLTPVDGCEFWTMRVVE